MKNLNPRIERLKEMLVLEEKRVALQGELDSIAQQLSALKDRLLDESGDVATSATKATRVPRKTVGKRQKRGLLKDKIMAALDAAGSAGVKVKDLAAAFGTKPVNIHSWFHSALKRDSAINKITGGHYRLDGKGASVAAKPVKKPAKAAVAAPKSKGPRGAKRGQLTAQILTALKDAGNGGTTVADLATKLGAKYKNIYIWFATTGKKNPSVKKLGPAKYKMAV